MNVWRLYLEITGCTPSVGECYMKGLVSQYGTLFLAEKTGLT